MPPRRLRKQGLLAGVKPFKLYANLLSDEAWQPWEKILKAQVTQAPWEDIVRIPHTKTPTKSWDSFLECVKFHLQTMFCFDAGEALKYYITNTLKKPNWVSIHQIFVRVEQLISYHETLLFYSPKANRPPRKYCPWMTWILGLTCCACVQPGGKPNTT